MVKDLKAYWDKPDRRPKSTGWVILAVSHMAIFVVGLTLGQWMGERFARVSSPREAVVQKADSDMDKAARSKDVEGKQIPQGTVKKEEAGKIAKGMQDRSEKEPEFTFYESLQKEKAPAAEIERKTEKDRRAEKPEDAGTASPLDRTRPEPKSQRSPSQVYYVQVSSFQREEMARNLAERLRERGYQTEVVARVVMNKGIWYRVVMGPFGNAREAREKAAAVKKSEKVKPFLVLEEGGENP